MSDLGALVLGAWLARGAQAQQLEARLAEIEVRPDGAHTAAQWRTLAAELSRAVKTTEGLHDNPAQAFRTYAALGRAVELGDVEDPEVRGVHVNHALRYAALLARRDPALLGLIGPQWRARVAQEGIVSRVEVWMVAVAVPDSASSIGSSDLVLIHQEGPLMALVSLGPAPTAAAVFWTDRGDWQRCARGADMPPGCHRIAVEPHAEVHPWGAGLVRGEPADDAAVTAFVEGLWRIGAVTDALVR